MDPLVLYYRRQAGRSREDIGSIYSTPPFVQREHGLGNVLAGLFRTLRPILWSGAKSIDKETLKALGREALAQALILLEI
jgi:ABC-type phosphate/phosphonate transport system ATPase subunit